MIGGQGNKLGVIFGAFIIAYLPKRLTSVELVDNESSGYLWLTVAVLIFVGLLVFWKFRGKELIGWSRTLVITAMALTGVMSALLLGSVLLFRQGGAQSLGDLKYLYFGIALVVMMILRPQGLVPVRQKLLTYGRQVYQAVRKPTVGEPIGEQK